MNIKTTTIFVIWILTMSCSTQDCETLPRQFVNYNKAVTIVEQTTFNFKDEVDTCKSSWIREANYYSCDKAKGYLIIETDSQNYIYQDVPIAVWEEFKQANSFGRYYNSYIKGNYKLSLKN